ncbi:hypothetical protein OIE62_29300 [Streptomyces scopuliridis]|uniref:Uncharacterized protein n=1 Tax=Streptomyces scopuliridis TaxID=452529 RepID=A0ACD4ZGW1_9ACTN|nr:hypothetical protein [Streptomyces scopuliridis]WSB33330.1 hypothetical protein OG949_10950 [Streptomyces scopuliridis]WSB97598.1 hypothetical protein OG835_11635 [Streptomyces scopuliridis]WSC08699.1 hypothetical protein OIE62_29300 [Streptomyces scopuliridis]
MTLSRRTPGAHWRPRPLVFATDTEAHRRLLIALRRHVRREQRAEGHTGYPVDIVTISRTVLAALALRVVLPERAWVDITILKLRGNLELLLREDLGDPGPLVGALREDARRLLDLSCPAAAPLPPLHAYELMRALAGTTRSFAVLYQLRRSARERGQ